MKKQKSANKSVAVVNFILDKSGSMDAIRESTISGFNEYVETLKKDGNEYLFSLTLFDTEITAPYTNQPIKNIPKLDKENYVPNGMTALYDAVCSTIKGVEEKEGQKVLNIIMTDGEENSSKEYSQVQMKALVEERTKKGNWTFVYLGANQDSYVTAQKFGIPQMNTANFLQTSDGMAKAMSMVASNTSDFATSTSSGVDTFFSQSNQDNLIAEDKISQHFSLMGKKSWEVRKKKLTDV